ncbi:hypothetical protein FH972_026710 [Carpinus fangiana]|uniref:Pre-mRNA-splicing factor CWC24 n=1 Tax=Carpinus fangiana TaxID=176857 RepID=A0A5N6L4W3_9ROSI|nr:hypothetical protein FH972_026710 [Carpinus fangiana]
MADTESAPPVALFKKRAGKTNARKRPATPPPQNSDSSSEAYSSADEATGARQAKRRRTGGVAAGSSATVVRRPEDTQTELKPTQFRASSTTDIHDTNDATKAADWYDEKALLGRSSHPKAALSQQQQKQASDGTYKGAAAYTTHIQRSQASLEKKSSIGPIKAPPSNIRTITVTDFAPDVCKDYKQTGFCGFGDSCKFLHAREDYKQGWELDKDWEKVNTGRKPAAGTVVGRADRSAKLGGESDDDEDAMLEGIPFACIICKEPYKNPIVTRCAHYFCEKCALDRYRKNPNCAACGEGTNGVFNSARGLKKILDRKRERAARRREKAIEAGEEVSSEGEE